MGVVKLGDASTWKLQETLKATQAARGAAPAGASDAAPTAPGIIRLPVSRPAAALPPAPKPDFKRKAWPDGKITVKYPAGFDPVTRQFRRDDGGAGASPRKMARVGGGDASAAPRAGATAPAADSEAKRKRAERFGVAPPAQAAPPADGDEAEALRQYEIEYAAAAAEQARLRAAFAELRREHVAAGAPARGGGRGASGRGTGRGANGRGQGGGHQGRGSGIASRVSLPGAAPARTASAAGPVTVAAKLGMSLDDLRRR